MRPTTNSKTTYKDEVKELLEEAYKVRINDLSLSITYTKRALKLAFRNKDEALEANAKSMMALFYMVLCNFKESKQLSLEALKYFEKVDDQKGIADAKFNIASLYYKTDHFHEGLQLLLDCLQIYRQLKDHHSEARVLKSMGTIYEYLGDINNAIQAYEDSVDAAKKVNDLNLESNAYNPLSGIYLNQGRYEDAMELIEKSIRLKKSTNDIRGLGFALYGRGKVHMVLGNYAESEKNFLESKKIHSEMGDMVGLGMTCNKMGALYFLMKDFNHSREILKEALSLAEKYNIILIKFKAYHHLYQMAKEEGDNANALYFLEKYMNTKESVINTHTYDVMRSYEAIARVRALERETKVQLEKAEIIEKKNVELDSFFYRISHDLKGPINSLEGLNNLVGFDIKDDVSKKYFEMYKIQIDRISRIVMELINLTRMNHQKIEMQKINFHLIVDDCIKSYQHFPNFSKLNFIKKIDQDLSFYSEWPVVNTIIQNLIENGIKYWRNKAVEPFVKISIYEKNGMVIIDAEDNGMGIEPKYQGKIFDMFYRANDNIFGTGLGLYILKRAVERLNGHVQVKSKPNVGSKFIVSLPK